jgi:hypothetical protein
MYVVLPIQFFLVEKNMQVTVFVSDFCVAFDLVVCVRNLMVQKILIQIIVVD